MQPAALLGQLVFQRLHPHRQRLERLLLLLDDADPISRRRRNPGNDSVFTWNVCGRDLFTTRQAERFYVPLLTDLYDFDNRNSAGFSA